MYRRVINRLRIEVPRAPEQLPPAIAASVPIMDPSASLPDVALAEAKVTKVTPVEVRHMAAALCMPKRSAQEKHKGHAQAEKNLLRISHARDGHSSGCDQASRLSQTADALLIQINLLPADHRQRVTSRHPGCSRALAGPDQCAWSTEPGS